MSAISDQLLLALLSGDEASANELRDQINSRNSADSKKEIRIAPRDFDSDYISAIKVFKTLNKFVGDKWYEYEIETIRTLLERAGFKNLKANVWDCIMAMKVVINTDFPCEDWDIFVNSALALSGAIADFDELRLPSAGMIISAINVIQYVKPKCEFSREVKSMICVLLRNDGLILPPPSIIHIINDEMIDQVALTIRKIWVDTYREYNDILSGKDIEPEADYHIQAMRIYKAEMAAKSYYEGAIS